ncbi:unnamed protein product [Brassica rapa subsp. narinosa]
MTREVHDFASFFFSLIPDDQVLTLASDGFFSNDLAASFSASDGSLSVALLVLFQASFKRYVPIDVCSNLELPISVCSGGVLD